MPNTQKPLGSWMSHFLERYTQYDLWIAHGEPKVIWLSGLHIPESCAPVFEISWRLHAIDATSSP